MQHNLSTFSPAAQTGRTLLGTLTLIISIIVIILGLFRVAPVYLSHYDVKSSIEALNHLDSGLFSFDAMSNVEVLKSKLMNQFDINGITDIQKDDIKIEPTTPGHYKVSVNYTVTRSLAGNVSLLFDFSDSEEVTVGPT